MKKLISLLVVGILGIGCGSKAGGEDNSTAALLALAGSGSGTSSRTNSGEYVESVPGDAALAKGSLVVAKYFGAVPLALNTSYTTAAGNTVTFSEIRYWLSNVKLIKADGSEVSLLDSYYLMTENNLLPADGDNYNAYPARDRESVDIWVPYGDYTGIKYSIGVDSTYNDDLGKHAGELHETSRGTDFFWMWSSSYIFSRTRGTCTSCTGTQAFLLDTGTNSNFRTITQNFPSTVSITKNTNSPQVTLKMDVKQFFTGINIQSLSVSNGKRIISATTPSMMSTLTDNVAASTSMVSASAGALPEANRVLVTLEVAKYFGTTPFALDTSFTNSSGNQLSLSSMRYWLSNLSLIKPDTTVVPAYDSYYLMAANNSETGDDVIVPSFITLAARNREKVYFYLPAGTYDKVRFSVGVDSTYNNDLTKHAGELRLYNKLGQDNGWYWFTSYVFSRMEGTCSSCADPKSFVIDTGSNSSYRTITIPLGQSVQIADNKDVKIKVKLDVSQLFTSINVGSLTGNPRIINATTPATMTTLADNYSNAFSLVEVTTADR